MEGFQHYHQQTVKKDRETLWLATSSLKGEGTRTWRSVTTFRQRVFATISQRPIREAKPRFRVRDKQLTVPDAQLLVDPAWLQDVNEVLQVIHVCWPRQVSADGANDLRGGNGYVLMLENKPRAPMHEQSLIKHKLSGELHRAQATGNYRRKETTCSSTGQFTSRCHRIPIWTLGVWQINQTYPFPTPVAAKNGINVFKFFNIH